MKKVTQRLDVALVVRGLFATRTRAQAAVIAGQVLVDGVVESKAGTPIFETSQLSVASGGCPYVSRGGLKLAAALKAFPVNPSGRVCLDVGSSTGGFTDCLLSQGARQVYAIDVGTRQLADRLRADPRVVSRENTHARDLRPNQFDPQPNLAVIDVSFISLTLILPHTLPCLRAPYDVIALIKPQFELGPKLAPLGVVRDTTRRMLAVEKVRSFLKNIPVHEAGLMECPVHGAKGNIEYFIHLQFSQTAD